VTFYASSPEIDPWQRAFRKGARTQLTLEHLMASLAIPFLFRPIPLQGQYYGDGAMRQTSPLSPAIHLGASRLLIIGVESAGSGIAAGAGAAAEPTFGQMFGFMLDSLFMDQIHVDVERVTRYNSYSGQRPIESLVMTPSQDLTDIARRHRHELPRSLRALLRTMGANNASGTQLLSYILFERGFTRELIALGMKDARARADELRTFMDVPAETRPRAARSS
jgi:NTE family protein